MAENNSSAPLLPCPFCGGAAAVQKESPAGGGYFVECKSCRASTNLRYACGDNPVPLLMERWNARAPQAAPAAVAVPASWADSEDDKPTSRADLERVLDAWNDTTGALPRDSGWRAEVLGMLHDAYDLGAHQATAGSEAKALAALRYYNSECTGQEPSLSVFQQMVDEALAAAPAVPDERWCPDVCPITGREFFMWVTHHESGADVPTYGGPFDSYTIPTQDKDGSFSCERYDHDFGGWKDWESVGLMLVDDQSFVVAPDNPRYYEIEQFATPEPPATEDSSAGDLVEVQAEPVAWMPVAGFEDAYEVSSSGDIRNTVTGKILAKNLMGSGYVKANLWSKGERKQTSVHRVVAQAFIPNPNGLAEVNHIDGDKTNNTIENLEWSDRQGNNNHALYGLGKRTKPVIAVDPESGEETYFPSINAAGRCGYNASGIYNVLNGLMHTHKGKHWVYTEWRTPGGTAPQAQPADALDAARYRYLRDGWTYHYQHESREKLDASLDAAMAAAQEGGNASAGKDGAA